MSQLSPYQIASNLQFGQGGNPVLGALGGGAGLAMQYGQGYNSALQANQQNYNNIIGGYSDLMNSMSGRGDSLMGNWNELQGSVSNTLGGNYGIPVGLGGSGEGDWGVAAPGAQAIKDLYAQQSGNIKQSVVGRGLGNTTVSDQLQRGPAADAAKAYGSLGAQLANLRAGYDTQIRGRGLDYANQLNQQKVGLGSRQLDFMNSLQIPYPDANQYASLYNQQGQYQQAALDRLLQQQLATGRIPGSGGRMGVGGGGGSAGTSQGGRSGITDRSRDAGGGGNGGIDPPLNWGQSSYNGSYGGAGSGPMVGGFGGGGISPYGSGLGTTGEDATGTSADPSGGESLYPEAGDFGWSRF